MAKQSIVPFGPQHPVLPEPIHLDLVLEDEKVIEAIPSIGFVHRGLESLVDKKDFKNFRKVISLWGFPGNSAGKEPTCNAGDPQFES